MKGPEVWGNRRNGQDRIIIDRKTKRTDYRKIKTERQKDKDR